MTRDFRDRNIAPLFSCISLLCGASMIANAADTKPVNGMDSSFSISVLGDGQYGENRIWIWNRSGKIRVRVSDPLTPDLKNFRGAGTIETVIAHDDLDKANIIFDRLCAFANPEIPVTPAARNQGRYSVQCLQRGRMINYGGALDDLPLDLWSEATSFYRRMIRSYCSEGRALVKIEAEVSDVRRNGEKFLVAVKFVNTGQYPVSVRTPDEWGERRSWRLNVSGWNEGNSTKWNAELAGASLINKSDLSTWVMTLPTGDQATLVTVPAGDNVVFKILALPDSKVPKGNYSFGALIITNMATRDRTGDTFDNGTLNLGAVDFVTSEHRTFTFDRDYPSTPDEWREYEARKREALSRQIIRRGEPFVEDGYYRLVSDSGQRSRFVTRFKRGGTAEIKTDSVDDRDKPFTGQSAWIWEADAALDATCDPEQRCPRDGHWVAITRDHGWMDKRYTLYPHTRRYFHTGEFMPKEKDAYDSELLRQEWYWLGI